VNQECACSKRYPPPDAAPLDVLQVSRPGVCAELDAIARGRQHIRRDDSADAALLQPTAAKLRLPIECEWWEAVVEQE
jgi:hypothetical protein